MIDIIFQFAYYLHKRKANIQQYNKIQTNPFISGENKNS